MSALKPFGEQSVAFTSILQRINPEPRHITLTESDAVQTTERPKVLRFPENNITAEDLGFLKYYSRHSHCHTINKLLSLLSLEPGWDSYQGKPISIRKILLLVGLVINTFDESTPSPYVVPTSEGGVQFEWHLKKYDLEIETLSSTHVGLLYSSPEEGDYEEVDISTGFNEIYTHISKLSQ